MLIMETSQPQGPFCQSCGMPLYNENDFGTNADGSKSNEYCHYCFKDGQFTDPSITVDQMIEKVSGMMAQMQGMPEDQARETAQNFIPQLKRWKM